MTGGVGLGTGTPPSVSSMRVAVQPAVEHEVDLGGGGGDDGRERRVGIPRPDQRAPGDRLPERLQQHRASRAAPRGRCSSRRPREAAAAASKPGTSAGASRGSSSTPRARRYAGAREPAADRDRRSPTIHGWPTTAQLKERHLNADGGRFVAESERVVRRLLGSGLPVLSVLVTAPRLATLADALGGPFPVYLASQAMLDAIAGFHVHRGCLAIGERPPPRRCPRDARAVVVLEDLTDVDNLGAIARHAAAFGADALVLSPRCADPFYRKAVRVSLGAVFSLPIVRASRWPDDLAALRDDGFSLVAAVVEPGATPLAALRPPGPVRAGARRRGARAVGGGARRLRPPRHHPDVAGRRFAQRRDGGRDLPVRPDARRLARQLTNSLRVSG